MGLPSSKMTLLEALDALIELYPGSLVTASGFCSYRPGEGKRTVEFMVYAEGENAGFHYATDKNTGHSGKTVAQAVARLRKQLGDKP